MANIKTLNDSFRRTFSGGRVMLTCGIRAKSQSEQTEILNQVRCFNDFTTANDPYNEHDFGSFNYKGEQIYWKIDYYDKNYQYCSEDPYNPNITNRVMTIMLAEEY